MTTAATPATTTDPAQWIEIFRVGTQTDMHGRKMEFTDAHLQELVDSYDPAVHEAPVVVGHPKHNLPAYGWIGALKVEDGKLLAQERQLEAQFQEMRESGRFKKRSASFYLADSPGNPTPGKLHLRHVGWLGAQPPAVKGLKDYEFADDGEGVIEFGDSVPSWVMGTLANTLSRIRDYFIDRDGLEAADRVVSTYDIQAIREAGLLADTRGLPSYGEGQPDTDTDDATKDPAAGVPAAGADGGTSAPTPEEEQAMTQKAEELAQRERELADREQAIKDREAQFSERERTERDEANRAVAVEFADGLVREGKLLPAQRDGVVALFRAAQGIEQPLAFGEGDAATGQPAVEVVRSVLGNLPKQFDFSEKSGDGGGSGLDANDPHAVAKAAASFQEEERKAGRTISTTQAVNHVTKGAK